MWGRPYRPPHGLPEMGFLVVKLVRVMQQNHVGGETHIDFPMTIRMVVYFQEAHGKVVASNSNLGFSTATYSIAHASVSSLTCFPACSYQLSLELTSNITLSVLSGCVMLANWEILSKLSLARIRVNLLETNEYDHLEDGFYNVSVLVDTTCHNTQPLLFQSLHMFQNVPTPLADNSDVTGDNSCQPPFTPVPIVAARDPDLGRVKISRYERVRNDPDVRSTSPEPRVPQRAQSQNLEASLTQGLTAFSRTRRDKQTSITAHTQNSRENSTQKELDIQPRTRTGEERVKEGVSCWTSLHSPTLMFGKGQQLLGSLRLLLDSEAIWVTSVLDLSVCYWTVRSLRLLLDSEVTWVTSFLDLSVCYWTVRSLRLLLDSEAIWVTSFLDIYVCYWTVRSLRLLLDSEAIWVTSFLDPSVCYWTVRRSGSLRLLLDNEAIWVTSFLDLSICYCTVRSLHLLLDSEVTCVTSFQRMTFLLDVYRPTSCQPLNVTVAGLVLRTHGSEFKVVFRNMEVSSRRRKNLNGQLMRAATVVSL
uniref:(California timema) hypothetical protein n=1 Tax=Timema californicum TaxID=61474 RepID=A0A7R9PBJ4_TIMCA|nr:unnamed protein product [Timema californicum]